MRTIGPGHPEPLGVTPERDGANIAVYSTHATAIEVCLYDVAGETEFARIALPARTGDVRHGFVAGMTAGDRYGLRAHGPYDPRNGHRFNPAKLLVDPYAKALDRPFALHPAMFGESADGAARDDVDSARFVPKAIATVTAPGGRAPDTRPRVAWDATILYELHVRGFTRTHPAIPEALRGTFAGLAHPAAIAHLARLGVTTVELMPIAAAIDERHLAEQRLTNYWGYNPGALFVPDPRLAPGGIAEMRACVAALHGAGIEVILDIVLNHTGEGDARGPTFSLRGLDNAAYYRGLTDDPARYVDDSGCGNTLALDRAPVLRLAMDVLRHYADATGVDGFRFDLATILGRRDDGNSHPFDPSAPLLQAIAQDPVLRELKLIAEPWDAGPGGHRLGAFPAPWGEWNDRYRDTVRRFWRGDGGLAGELATRLAGSADVFAARSRAPSRSVNFVTAHDGFTLADLVSFAQKHNEDNGEANRDGSDANHSWNHGVEGPSSDHEIRDRRARDVRSLLATLLVSRGTPMLAMGDEFGRTQRGNNNAYAHDSALTWIDWQRADNDLADFVAALIDLRRRHPALHADRWLSGRPADDGTIADVLWRHADGRAMDDHAWSDPDTRALVASFHTPATDSASEDRVAVAFNAGNDPVSVRWPDPQAGRAWRLCIDTSLPSGRPSEGAAGRASGQPDSTPMAGHSTVVQARSLVLVEEVPAAIRTERTRDSAGVDPEWLERLAGAAGIAGEWWDIGGERHVVQPDTQHALLAAMGIAVGSNAEARDRLAAMADARERRPLPAFILARAGAAASAAIALPDECRHRSAALRLRLEDGNERLLPFALDDLPVNRVTAADGRTVVQRIVSLPALPMGSHALTFDDDDGPECRVIVAPERCHLPEEIRAGGRRFGLAAHLYSLRRRGDQGIGDFTTLALLAERTARAGGSIVGINPLHALFAGDRERASPYHPSDRRFLDPIYIDIERLDDLAASHDARRLLEHHGPRLTGLRTGANVDYPAVWEVKRAVLDACFAQFERRPDRDARVTDFDRFVAEGGMALARFALFEAIAAAHPRVPWQRWPDGLRGPDGAGIAEFAGRHARAVRFGMYLQWLADRQLGEAAARARSGGLAQGFFRDLAVGTAADGGEPWADQDAYAKGVSIGAPPDPFSVTGQNWGLPPPNPLAMAATACSAHRALLAANMRHAGALRIDHVMGLSRLFWIPDGGAAADGAYVDYPLDALLHGLALESTRARCLVVGEDLGTVPEGLRERLAARDILSYRVLWFERDGTEFIAPSRYPVRAAACVSTHDLPTVAGWWSGADIDERRALGQLTDDAARLAYRERQTARAALVAALARAGATRGERFDEATGHGNAITSAIHRFVCATPSALVLLQADDLAGESMAVNLPGTDRERPNWRRRLDVDVEALWKTETGTQVIADFVSRQTDDAQPRDNGH